MKNILEEIKFDAAFIKGHTLQPQWYKVLKIFLILGFLVGYSLIFGSAKTLIFCGVFFGLGLILHMAYRINTINLLEAGLILRLRKRTVSLNIRELGAIFIWP